MVQRCESGRLIVDVKLPPRRNRKYETECKEEEEEEVAGGGGVGGGACVVWCERAGL